MKTKFLYILLLIATSFAARAQEPGIEDAERCLKNAKQSFNPDTVRLYADTAYSIALRLGDKRLIARSLDNLAWASFANIQHDSAIDYYKQELAVALNIEDTSLTAHVYCNLGICYQYHDQYYEMWNNFRQAADLYAILGDTANLSWAICSMGSSYAEMDMFDKAKELYREALSLVEKSGDTTEIGAVLHSIADCTSLQYFHRSGYDVIDSLKVAMTQFHTAASILKKAPEETFRYAQNLIGMARCYICLASLMNRTDYADSCDVCLAEYWNDYKNDKDSSRILRSKMIKIQSLIFRKQFTKALPALESIIPNFMDNRHILQLSEVYRLMSICYKSLGKYNLALEYGEKHLSYHNKTHDDETMKHISNFAAQTELYNVRKDHDAYNRRQQEILDTEQSQQRKYYALMSLAVSAVIVLALLVSIMLYRRRHLNTLLRRGNETRAALNDEYMKQLKAVADAQDIIVDSVEYASMIQSETIGSVTKVKEMFPDSFVYFRPRDIVSGDWYYTATVNNHKMIVTADCTGHGIPGAVLSMLGVGALKDIINELVTNDENVIPGIILDRMRVLVKKALNKNKDTENAIVDDGMDMTIIVIPPEGTELHFGAANQSAIIVHKGEAKRMKGDINSIGNNIREKEHFTTITTEISAGDTVYMFSDGVIDQITNINPESSTHTTRKFSFKQLIAFAAENYSTPMDQQLQKFKTRIDNWTGTAPQLDDRLLIGFRL